MRFPFIFLSIHCYIFIHCFTWILFCFFALCNLQQLQFLISSGSPLDLATYKWSSRDFWNIESNSISATLSGSVFQVLTTGPMFQGCLLFISQNIYFHLSKNELQSYLLWKAVDLNATGNILRGDQNTWDLRVEIEDNYFWWIVKRCWPNDDLFVDSPLRVIKQSRFDNHQASMKALEMTFQNVPHLTITLGFT